MIFFSGSTNGSLMMFLSTGLKLFFSGQTSLIQC